MTGPTSNGLVLSLFPGIDLLGRGFEEAGFCVVRGPDLIFGGDVRSFHPPAGVFVGVIGGPPCQDFSDARRDDPTGEGLEMLGEFERVVLEASPNWWLMENVRAVPDLRIEGYGWQRIDVRASEFGLPQNRLRHLQFGDRDRRSLILSREEMIAREDLERCVTASESARGFAKAKALQGLPDDFDLPGFTVAGKVRAVGNGVPVPMAKGIAEAISRLSFLYGVKDCACGCARAAFGSRKYATAACRKRMQRRREAR